MMLRVTIGLLVLWVTLGFGQDVRQESHGDNSPNAIITTPCGYDSAGQAIGDCHAVTLPESITWAVGTYNPPKPLRLATLCDGGVPEFMPLMLVNGCLQSMNGSMLDSQMPSYSHMRVVEYPRNPKEVCQMNEVAVDPEGLFYWCHADKWKRTVGEDY